GASTRRRPAKRRKIGDVGALGDRRNVEIIGDVGALGDRRNVEKSATSASEAARFRFERPIF
ncbi:MAG: hypothetical protein IJN32_09605, partial [Thermoguttaceae bacterium]|nr:hypothetical protein [Thermoguttaceae bacterium]